MQNGAVGADLPLKQKLFMLDDRPPGETADEVWANYCAFQSVDGHWGDNLTLTAIAELKRCPILIISSANAGSGGYVFELQPSSQSAADCASPILLCHWAEYHYGSLLPRSGSVPLFYKRVCC